MPTEKQETYIIALTNSETGAIFTELVKGTENQVKHYILHMLEIERRDVMDNGDGDWDYGDESLSDIDVASANGKNILNVGGAWPNFYIRISARPADTTPTKTLNNKCSYMKKYGR